jgi:hypothetical protein
MPYFFKHKFSANGTYVGRLIVPAKNKTQANEKMFRIAAEFRSDLHLGKVTHGPYKLKERAQTIKK